MESIFNFTGYKWLAHSSSYYTGKGEASAMLWDPPKGIQFVSDKIRIKTRSSWLSDQVCPLLCSLAHTCPSSFVFPGVDTCQLCKVRCSGASGSLSSSYGTPGPLCREAGSLWKPPRGLQPQGLAVLCRTRSLPNYPCPATRKLPSMLESGRASALWTRL